MDLENLRAKAAELFPQVVKFAIANPGSANAALDELNSLCAANYAAAGFSCNADLFSEIVPKPQGELNPEAWCEADLEIFGWNVRITMRPFYLGAGYVHFQVVHDGPWKASPQLATARISRPWPLSPSSRQRNTWRSSSAHAPASSS